ncbi:MAG: hypothetical protein ACMG57_00445 [Candidatus Dojkabacteria bacterium]
MDLPKDKKAYSWENFKSYNDYLKEEGKDLLNLSEEQCKLLNAARLLKKTNDIRKKLEEGFFDEMNSEQTFNSMFGEYLGNSPRDIIISLYDSNERGNDSSESTFEQTANKLDQIPGEDKFFKAYNQNFRNLVNNAGVTGVPSVLIEPLTKDLFSKVDNFITQTLKYPFTIPDEEIYRFAAAASSLLGFIHPKPDGNGRVLDDWMIYIQRRLFKGDMSKIKAWSQSGLRSSNIEEYIPEDYKDAYARGKELMIKRRVINSDFSKNVLNLFKESLPSKKQLLSSLQNLIDTKSIDDKFVERYQIDLEEVIHELEEFYKTNPLVFLKKKSILNFISVQFQQGKSLMELRSYYPQLLNDYITYLMITNEGKNSIDEIIRSNIELLSSPYTTYAGQLLADLLLEYRKDNYKFNYFDSKEVFKTTTLDS